MATTGCALLVILLILLRVICSVENNFALGDPSGVVSDNPEFWCPDACHCLFSERIIDCSTLGLKQVPSVPSSTVRLYLDNNDINELKVNDFSDLSDLTYLVLSHNSLHSLPENVFTDLTALQYLVIDSNRIEEIPTRLLRNTRQLLTLSLARNMLSSLPNGVFQYTEKLAILNLQYNRLGNDVILEISRISTLLTLLLDYNLLTSFITPDTFPAIQSLHLASNGIQTVSSPVLFNCSALSILDLSNNSISEFDPNVLKECHSLQKLSLNHNKLTRFSSFGGSIRSLYLHGNNIPPLPMDLLYSMTNLTLLQFDPMPCNCSLHSMAMWAHTRLVKGLRCWIPGRGLAKITSLLETCSYRGVKDEVLSKGNNTKDNPIGDEADHIMSNQHDFLSVLLQTTPQYSTHQRAHDTVSTSCPSITTAEADCVSELKSLNELVKLLQDNINQLHMRLHSLETFVKDTKKG